MGESRCEKGEEKGGEGEVHCFGGCDSLVDSMGGIWTIDFTGWELKISRVGRLPCACASETKTYFCC